MNRFDRDFDYYSVYGVHVQVCGMHNYDVFSKRNGTYVGNIKWFASKKSFISFRSDRTSEFGFASKHTDNFGEAVDFIAQAVPDNGEGHFDSDGEWRYKAA